MCVVVRFCEEQYCSMKVLDSETRQKLSSTPHRFQPGGTRSAGSLVSRAAAGISVEQGQRGWSGKGKGGMHGIDAIQLDLEQGQRGFSEGKLACTILSSSILSSR